MSERMTTERLERIRSYQTGPDADCGDCLDLLRELDAVRAERDEARKDSARLEWLGDGDNDGATVYWYSGRWCYNGQSFAAFREAVDAAMADLAEAP